MHDEKPVNENIQVWMAECTQLVTNHLRSKGFPLEDYRIDLRLVQKPIPVRPIVESLPKRPSWMARLLRR